MRIPKLEFQKYIDSKYEECLELFELNCPTYFAEEERKDYKHFWNMTGTFTFQVMRMAVLYAVLELQNTIKIYVV